MDVAAKNATVEPSDGRARRNDSVAANQMVLMGARKRSSTYLCVSFGIQYRTAFTNTRVQVIVPY